ncbi:hypothetical protein DVH24_040087 [Malus domestica]|uniref:DUF7356 domain-containing protein n=1 Tax=Malus domestica TaxID=3750 RepID=A0A498I3K0_MALDO|nr:hypothetical protein DVH24_040087 [Malus domestica]
MQTSRIARIADFKHCRIGGEEANDEVRAAGGTDAEGGAAEALEGELALANEGAGITAGLGFKPSEDLNNQLARRHMLILSWPCIAPWRFHNSLWLHHQDRIMQLRSYKLVLTESGVTTDLDRKSLLASDNSNGSIDNIVGSNSVLNANNVQKVKKDGDQVVGSNEGIGDKKSNPSKEVGVKESDNVAKSGEGSSEGSKLEGKDKKQKQSDGLESKELPKEVDNGANTVFVNLIRKEGTQSEECDTSNICTDKGNQLVVCLKVLGNGYHFSDSHHLSLLIKNMAKGRLLVTIVTPDFVRLDETKIQLEEKENRKVSVKNTKELFDHKIFSVGKGGAGSSIVLKARNGRCNLDLKDLITNTSRKEPENSSNFAYINFPKQKPTIAILFIASAMILASAWMCISFRNRRFSGSGLKYQKLDKDLPISNGKNRVLHVNDVWDNNWDNNWDDEEAPHTPSMPITPSLSGKGLASRRLNKEA